jgi:hypothetical protein
VIFNACVLHADTLRFLVLLATQLKAEFPVVVVSDRGSRPGSFPH